MPEPLVTDLHTASARFVHWLDQRVLQAGRGDTIHASDVEPAGRFWLGRLATEEEVKAAPWGTAPNGCSRARSASGCVRTAPTRGGSG
jgi:hypothetical protein